MLFRSLDLCLTDINWPKRQLGIGPSKGKRARIVPVTQDALNELSNYLRLERPVNLAHDVVFVNLGRRGRGKPLSYDSWAKVCHTACQKSGIQLHAHSFRHTFATNMAEAGMPLDVLKDIMGHAHIETTMIYNHVRPDRLSREYDGAMAVQAADRVLGEASRRRADDGSER